MLTKEMAEIDWNKTGREIHNLVRVLSLKIGAYTFYNGKKIKIWKTQIIKEDELEEIIKNKIKTLTLNKKLCYHKYGQIGNAHLPRW